MPTIVPCTNPRCPSRSQTHRSGSRAHRECLAHLAKQGGVTNSPISVETPPPTQPSFTPLSEVPVKDESTSVPLWDIRPGDRIDMMPLVEHYSDEDPDASIWNYEIAEVTEVSLDGGGRVSLTVTGDTGNEEVYVLPEYTTLERYDFVTPVPRPDDQEYMAKRLDLFEQAEAGVSTYWDELTPQSQASYRSEAGYLLRSIGSKREFSHEDLQEVAEGFIEMKVDSGEIQDPVSQEDYGRATDYVYSALSSVGRVATPDQPVLNRVSGLASALQENDEVAYGMTEGKDYYMREAVALIDSVGNPDDAEYEDHLLNLTNEIISRRHELGEIEDPEGLSYGQMADIQQVAEIVLDHLGIKDEEQL